jgi:ATP-dependent helicase HrpB
VDVQSGARGEGSEARIRLASAIDGDWLVPNRSELVHRFDRESETVRALAVEKYDELPLTERPVEPDPEIAAQLVGEAFLARGLTHADRQLLRRLRFAGIDVDPDDLVRRAAQGATALRHVRLAQHLPPEARAIDRLAPESLKVPSGRTVPLEYQEDGTVSASVRLQELFGLAETPRIGPRHEPVLLSLLAPNGRPVQITRDLRSFWDAVYPEVRKELRGRYPKHAWPDDPWTATPTSRATRKP